VPERLDRARAFGADTIDLSTSSDPGEVIRDLTAGRGVDAVIDAVGMEAHGAPGAKLAQQMTGFLPDAVAQRLMKKAGVDRPTARSRSSSIRSERFVALASGITCDVCIGGGVADVERQDDWVAHIGVRDRSTEPGGSRRSPVERFTWPSR